MEIIIYSMLSMSGKSLRKVKVLLNVAHNKYDYIISEMWLKAYYHRFTGL